MKKIVIAPIMIIAFMLLAMPMFSAMGAAGTTGTIDYDQTSLAEDTLVYVHFKDLTVSATYKVNTSEDATGFSFTTGKSQTDIYVPIKFAMPADGENDFIIYLYGDVALTALDSVTVFVTEVDTILNDAAFLTIAVPLIVIALIVSIVVGLSVKKR